MASNLTQREVEECHARIQEFIRRMRSIPEAQRTLYASEKFWGPVGRPVETPHEKYRISPGDEFLDYLRQRDFLAPHPTTERVTAIRAELGLSDED